jgi:hypothetical protein
VCSPISVGVEDRRLAEGIVDVTLDHVARIVKERYDLIVGVLVVFSAVSDLTCGGRVRHQ